LPFWGEVDIPFLGEFCPRVPPFFFLFPVLGFPHTVTALCFPPWFRAFFRIVMHPGFQPFVFFLKRWGQLILENPLFVGLVP